MKDKLIVEAVSAYMKKIDEFFEYFEKEEIDDNMEIKKDGIITDWCVLKRLCRDNPSIVVNNKETKIFLQKDL